MIFQQRPFTIIKNMQPSAKIFAEMTILTATFANFAPNLR